MIGRSWAFIHDRLTIPDFLSVDRFTHSSQTEGNQGRFEFKADNLYTNDKDSGRFVAQRNALHQEAGYSFRHDILV